jgi:Ca2+/Na+ antiporter
MSADTLRHGAYVAGVVVGNVLVAGVTWRILGAKSRNLRRLGRALGATFFLANLALGLVCLLYLLQHGGDWFYAALLLIAGVFAFRIGGTTAGRYP